MKLIECEFEAETLAAVVQSRWPERVDPQLRAHVEVCAICSDVAAVAGAIEADRDAARPRVVAPDSGRVWWIAQLRARREAVEAAGRPITAAQVIALACAVGLLKWVVLTIVPSAAALLAAVSSRLSGFGGQI